MNGGRLLRFATTVSLLGLTDAWTSSPKCFDRTKFLQQAGSLTLLGTTGVAGNSARARAATTNRQAGRNPRVYSPGPGSLDGKIVVITGASSGLGLESAKRLAAAGATTVLTTRTEEKGAKAVDEVRAYLSERCDGGGGAVLSLTLDLDDLDSIKSFPMRYSQLVGACKISVLMNNAGVAAIPDRQITKDGFERTFQSNHLGPFLLTAKLFPYLDRENGARVINVSSIAHSYATIVSSGSNGLDMDNLNGELQYEGWPSYTRTKLENILFTQELQRRADSAGLEWLTAVSLHPGVVGTDIWRNSYLGTKVDGGRDFSLQTTASNIFYGSILTTEEGANTQVWLSALGESDIRKVKGLYFDEKRNPKKLEKFAKDTAKAKLLWDRSEALLGTEFKVE